MSISSVPLDFPRPCYTGAALANVDGPVTKVDLRAGDLWSLPGPSRWKVIICLRGVVWVTQERDPRDYVLMQGEMFLVTQPGTVVVAAMEDACIQVTLSLRTAPYRGQLPIFR